MYLVSQKQLLLSIKSNTVEVCRMDFSASAKNLLDF